MYQNTKEKMIFTGLMCGCMILGMSAFNIMLQVGFNLELLIAVLSGFIPIFVIGFLLDWFVVGRFAKWAQSKVIPADASMKQQIVSMQVFMVLGMCCLMSSITTLMHMGFSQDVYLTILITIARNLLVALLLQIVIVSPFVRAICQRIFVREV